MTDWPSPSANALPLFVSSQGHLGPQIFQAGGNTPAARTWVAKLVSYCPMWLPWDYPVNRVWWVNGSTITTTNVQFGVYTDEGILIYATASTAMVGASSVQYVTPATPFVLSGGACYFAWTCDNTTSRGFAPTGTALNMRLIGLLEETTGTFGLPATMTPVAFARAWGPSVCGITRTTTGF